MPKCIYCLREDNVFDRDHVLPEAYGTFEPNSFVLHDTVCKSCNGELDRTIEQVFARDSMEAILRFRYGIKAPSKAGSLPYRRLELTVGQPGPWFGARVVLTADRTGSTVEPIPLPQVAFCWRGSDEWVYFQESELDTTRLAEYANPVPGTLEIRVMGPLPPDHERIVTKLKNLGIRFQQEGSLSQPLAEDGNILVQLAVALDQMIFRAIAKIAYNYVAFHCGQEFVLRSEFDDLRNYIRYGTVPRWAPVVRLEARPILFEDSRRCRQTHGHLITFDWDEGRTGLMARISLFNEITYRVTVCPPYKGIWHDGLRIGHHFNIDTRSIEPLGSTRLVRP